MRFFPEFFSMDQSTADPEALAHSFAEAAERGAKLLGDFVAKQTVASRSLASDELGIAKAFMDLTAKMMANPHHLVEAQMNLWWDYMSLWQGSFARMMGHAAAPVIEPAKGDKRFKHEDWQEHFLFDYVKQSYLIAARWLHNTVANVEGLDDEATKKVAQKPLLIIPPWINKYYILDLREKNSLVKWCVDQGLTVFVVSWINPDARYADKGFDDYMTEGPLAALDAIQAATGEKEVNALGYCLGGTLLAATLAYLAAKKDKRILSGTFMTALTDFSEPG